MTTPPKFGDGPSLETYIETRFNLFQESMKEALAAMDLRIQQRFDAQEKAVKSTLESTERAIAKADAATEKRFESVNEFRGQLNDQQNTFMPRNESITMHAAAAEKIQGIKETLDRMTAERQGVRGGYGYAVGIVGFVLTIITIGMLVFRAIGP